MLPGSIKFSLLCTTLEIISIFIIHDDELVSNRNKNRTIGRGIIIVSQKYRNTVSDRKRKQQNMYKYNPNHLCMFCGKRETEAAPFAHNARTFDPDLSVHRFYQLFTDVETQASATYRTVL